MIADRWVRVSSVLPAVLAACARVTTGGELADAGAAGPQVLTVAPAPGPVEQGAAFTLQFNEAMDEGSLLQGDGTSQTVALADAAVVERAVAALEHGRLTAEEQALLVPAHGEIAGDAMAFSLTPDAPLAPGSYFLLLAARLKDAQGRKLAAAQRFAYAVAQPAPKPTLLSPHAGSQAPLNLAAVRASAEGKLSLVDDAGAVLAQADAHGETRLVLTLPLAAGARYRLALDGVADDEAVFTAADCTRAAPPAVEGGAVQIAARATDVAVHAALDWPATAEIAVADASGAVLLAHAAADCPIAACAPQTFDCALDARVEGLAPATDYVLTVGLEDDEGHAVRTAPQRFSTVAPLPHVLVSELMLSPPGPSPRSEGEFIEIENLGPGAVDVSALALVGADGVARPLLAAPPPLPVVLAPKQRALAVGASFDPSRYRIAAGVPILRASTKRLLAHGLAHAPPFRLAPSALPAVELSSFDGVPPACPQGASLVREAEGPFTCGAVGGTPGT